MNKHIKNLLRGKCEICGFDRYTERCHIVPRRLGGGYTELNIVNLCPNHHKLFDYGLLNNEETAKIEHFLLVAIEENMNNLKVQDYLYFQLKLKNNPPKWLGTKRREILKTKETNAFF